MQILGPLISFELNVDLRVLAWAACPAIAWRVDFSDATRSLLWKFLHHWHNSWTFASLLWSCKTAGVPAGQSCFLHSLGAKCDPFFGFLRWRYHGCLGCHALWSIWWSFSILWGGCQEGQIQKSNEAELTCIFCVAALTAMWWIVFRWSPASSLHRLSLSFFHSFRG